MYCIVLYCIVLYCMVLYCITIHAAWWTFKVEQGHQGLSKTNRDTRTARSDKFDESSKSLSDFELSSPSLKTLSAIGTLISSSSTFVKLVTSSSGVPVRFLSTHLSCKRKNPWNGFVLTSVVNKKNLPRRFWPSVQFVVQQQNLSYFDNSLNRHRVWWWYMLNLQDDRGQK